MKSERHRDYDDCRIADEIFRCSSSDATFFNHQERFIKIRFFLVRNSYFRVHPVIHPSRLRLQSLPPTAPLVRLPPAPHEGIG
jgi:hypothetical protein